MIITDTLKTLKTIESRDKLGPYLFLFCMGLIGAGLETLGIGLILPMAMVILQPESAASLPFVSELSGRLPARFGEHHLAVFIGLAIFLLFIIKNIFMIFFKYYQLGVIAKWSRQLTCRMYSIYLYAPYIFHKTRNSAEIIRNSTGLIAVSYTGIVKALINLMVDFLVITMVTGFLVYLQPVPALIACGALLLLVIGQNKVFGKMFRRLGETHYELAKHNIKNLIESYGAIKEIKILGAERRFVSLVDSVQEQWEKNRHIQDFVVQLPPILLEIVLILLISIFIVALTVSNRDVSSVLANILLFGAAIIRLSPLSSRITNSFHQLNKNIAGLKIISGELAHAWADTLVPIDAQRPVGKGKLDFRNVLQIKHVTYTYPQGKKPALTDITLDIPYGEYIGLIGNSGAGKSTLVDLLLGLLPCDQGEILVDGANINDHISEWRASIGYVPQEIYILDDTIRANVALGTGIEQQGNDASVWKALERAQLADFVRSLPEGLDTRAGERGDRFSGGQKQRLGIARALYSDPSVLIMDEPTSDLDVETESGIAATLASLKKTKTIIVIAHRLAMLKDADRLVQIDDGRVLRQGDYQTITGLPVILSAANNN